jgi:hypothetical protein
MTIDDAADHDVKTGCQPVFDSPSAQDENDRQAACHYVPVGCCWRRMTL